MSNEQYYPSDSDEVTIPADAEIAPTIPATGKTDWYGLADGRDIKIITSEVRPVKGKGGVETGERYLDIGVMVDGVFVHTSPYRDHTKFTAASGSKASLFITQLGHNPASFRPAALIGTPVMVQVKLVERTDKETGEKVARNHISNIRLKE